ncbi:hypothetical protein CTEN210_03650 [Chaetoceros tenuissimus]|uniref:Uncharacterized protein n=1 Tax=Chaetoceros tenuissimus TaxID=426638 RepID=A0AAD3CM26_9STRA|nr:hypothetical protein CTEN210_03650 [Chaetoceros tenuissimus]
MLTKGRVLYARAFIASHVSTHTISHLKSSNNFPYLGSMHQKHHQEKIHGCNENRQSRHLLPSRDIFTLYANNHENHNVKASEIDEDIQTIKVSKREQVKNLLRRLWLKMPFVTLDENSKEIQDVYGNESMIDKEENMQSSSDGQGNVTSTSLQDSQLIDVIPSESATVSMDSTNTNPTELISTELESLNTLDTPTEESIPSIISTTDLSGTWKPKVTNQFKSEYDEYLLNCSQSFMFRKVIVNGIALQKEIIQQHGNDLQITATNPAGNWDRTLIYNETISIKDPDGDLVTVESIWEDEGRIHRSWLRNKPRVHGGVFDTRRYLDSNVDELVCESQFIPATGSEDRFKVGHIIWRFERC